MIDDHYLEAETGPDTDTLLLVVVGAHLRAELTDRPLAYMLVSSEYCTADSGVLPSLLAWMYLLRTCTESSTTKPMLIANNIRMYGIFPVRNIDPKCFDDQAVQNLDFFCIRRT